MSLIILFVVLVWLLVKDHNDYEEVLRAHRTGVLSND